jgi:hypothetical protein
MTAGVVAPIKPDRMRLLDWPGEIAERAKSERLVRMMLVVMLEPGIELAEDGVGVGPRLHSCVVALEAFDEGLGHAVALRAFDRRCSRYQLDLSGEGSGLLSGVGRAVIGEPLDRDGQAIDPTVAAFDALDHEVADVTTANATSLAPWLAIL